MDPRNSRDTGNQTLILWLISGALTMALIFARAVFPELLWATALIAILLVATLGYLVKTNHQSLRSRSAAYGINSIVTVVLVIGIICVLVASRCTPTTNTATTTTTPLACRYIHCLPFSSHLSVPLCLYLPMSTCPSSR